jgi:hypothetical protein
MRSQNEILDRCETRDICAVHPEVNDGLKIEEILRRAQEIHRERGGMFGYDFEDWLQAWRELSERGGRRDLEDIKSNTAVSI